MVQLKPFAQPTTIVTGQEVRALQALESGRLLCVTKPPFDDCTVSAGVFDLNPDLAEQSLQNYSIADHNLAFEWPSGLLVTARLHSNTIRSVDDTGQLQTYFLPPDTSIKQILPDRGGQHLWVVSYTYHLGTNTTIFRLSLNPEDVSVNITHQLEVDHKVDQISLYKEDALVYTTTHGKGYRKDFWTAAYEQLVFPKVYKLDTATGDVSLIVDLSNPPNYNVLTSPAVSSNPEDNPEPNAQPASPTAFYEYDLFQNHNPTPWYPPPEPVSEGDAPQQYHSPQNLDHSPGGSLGDSGPQHYDQDTPQHEDTPLHEDLNDPCSSPPTPSSRTPLPSHYYHASFASPGKLASAMDQPDHSPGQDNESPDHHVITRPPVPYASPDAVAEFKEQRGHHMFAEENGINHGFAHRYPVGGQDHSAGFQSNGADADDAWTDTSGMQFNHAHGMQLQAGTQHEQQGVQSDDARNNAHANAEHIPNGQPDQEEQAAADDTDQFQTQLLPQAPPPELHSGLAVDGDNNIIVFHRRTQTVYVFRMSEANECTEVDIIAYAPEGYEQDPIALAVLHDGSLAISEGMYELVIRVNVGLSPPFDGPVCHTVPVSTHNPFPLNQKLLDTGDFSDLTIKVNHQGHTTELAVHKAILSAAAEHFDQVLHDDALLDVIEIEGIEPDAVRSMLQYLYTGCFECAEDNLAGIIMVAQMYGLHDLLEACSDCILRKCVRLRNAASWLELVDTLGLKALTKSLVLYVRYHWGLIWDYARDQISIMKQPGNGRLMGEVEGAVDHYQHQRQ